MDSIHVVNMALSYLNLDEISSLDDAHPNAQAARLNWDACRLGFLQEYHWSFAKSTAILARLSAAPGAWKYRYSCPVDMLSAIRVVAQSRYDVAGSIPFEIAYSSDADNKILYADIGDAVLEYTSSKAKVSVFSPLAVEALAWRLAFTLCQILKGEAGELQVIFQTYQDRLKAATARDAEGRSYPRLQPGRVNRSRITGSATKLFTKWLDWE